MSFGFSPSDIVALIAITTKAYRGWKHACGEYADITSSLDGLLIVLERVEREAKKPNSILRRTTNDRNDLKDILYNCESTVRELHAVIASYKSLGSSREKNWDRLRFGVKDLSGLRSKLTQHVATISAFLDTIGLGALGRVEEDLQALPERIQRTVDGLAAEIRAGRREGSVMTTYDDDEKDVWRQFRRELIGDGMRSSIIHKYKPNIRKYLRELAERGLLEELALEEQRQDGGETETHLPSIDEDRCSEASGRAAVTALSNEADNNIHTHCSLEDNQPSAASKEVEYRENVDTGASEVETVSISATSAPNKALTRPDNPATGGRTVESSNVLAPNDFGTTEQGPDYEMQPPAYETELLADAAFIGTAQWSVHFDSATNNFVEPCSQVPEVSSVSNASQEPKQIHFTSGFGEHTVQKVLADATFNEGRWREQIEKAPWILPPRPAALLLPTELPDPITRTTASPRKWNHRPWSIWTTNISDALPSPESSERMNLFERRPRYSRAKAPERKPFQIPLWTDNGTPSSSLKPSERVDFSETTPGYSKPKSPKWKHVQAFDMHTDEKTTSPLPESSERINIFERTIDFSISEPRVRQQNTLCTETGNVALQRPPIKEHPEIPNDRAKYAAYVEDALNESEDEQAHGSATSDEYHSCGEETSLLDISTTPAQGSPEAKQVTPEANILMPSVTEGLPGPTYPLLSQAALEKFNSLNSDGEQLIRNKAPPAEIDTNSSLGEKEPMMDNIILANSNQAERRIYPKVHAKYLSRKSLEYYDIPWEYYGNKPEFIIILCEMDGYEVDILLEHTREHTRYLQSEQPMSKPPKSKRSKKRANTEVNLYTAIPCSRCRGIGSTAMIPYTKAFQAHRQMICAFCDGSGELFRSGWGARARPDGSSMLSRLENLHRYI